MFCVEHLNVSETATWRTIKSNFADKTNTGKINEIRIQCIPQN